MKRMFIVLVTLVTIHLSLPFSQYAAETPTGSGWFTNLPSLPSASAYLPTAETLQNITQQMTQNKAVFGAALTGALGMGGYLAQKAYGSIKSIPYADEAKFISELAKITKTSVYLLDPNESLKKLDEIQKRLPDSLLDNQALKPKMIELEKIIRQIDSIARNRSSEQHLAWEKDLKKVFVDICLLTLLPIINKELKTDIKSFEATEGKQREQEQAPEESKKGNEPFLEELKEKIDTPKRTKESTKKPTAKKIPAAEETKEQEKLKQEKETGKKQQEETRKQEQKTLAEQAAAEQAAAKAKKKKQQK